MSLHEHLVEWLLEMEELRFQKYALLFLQTVIALTKDSGRFIFILFLILFPCLTFHKLQGVLRLYF